MYIGRVRVISSILELDYVRTGLTLIEYFGVHLVEWV